jgi:hypothetical protein
MLSSTWDHIQGFLFLMLREEAGPQTAQHEQLVVVLDLATTCGLIGQLAADATPQQSTVCDTRCAGTACRAWAVQPRDDRSGIASLTNQSIQLYAAS